VVFLDHIAANPETQAGTHLLLGGEERLKELRTNLVGYSWT
jgi:hypothetical protein